MEHLAATLSRRTAVRLAAVAGTGLAVGSVAGPAAARPPAGTVLAHGVASGDPLPDGVILWTRVTPNPGATPGSGQGPRVDVGWQVAADPRFRRIVRRGPATTDALRPGATRRCGGATLGDPARTVDVAPTVDELFGLRPHRGGYDGTARTGA